MMVQQDIGELILILVRFVLAIFVVYAGVATVRMILIIIFKGVAAPVRAAFKTKPVRFALSAGVLFVMYKAIAPIWVAAGR